MKVKGNRRAVFIAAFISVASTALTNVWSVFLKPMAEGCGCEISTAQLSYSFYALSQAICGIVAAQLLDRLGLRRIVVIGSAAMSLGLAGMGLAHGPAMLFFSFSFLFGLGAGFVYTPSVANALKWYSESKGRTSGMLLAAASIMGIISAPVANALIENTGINNCCFILCAAFTVAFAATVWMVQEAPEVKAAPAAGEQAESGHIGLRDLTWKEMLRDRRFYVALTMFVCANTGYIMMISTSSALAQAYTGMSASAAAIMVAATSGFNLIGRLFFGWLSDRISRVKVLAGVCILEFAVLIGLSMITGQFIFAAGVCLVGMVGGALLANLPTLCSDSFGMKYSSQNYSLLITGFSISSYVAPFIMSLFGTNYSAILICAGCLGLAGALLVLQLGRMNAKLMRVCQG